MWAYVCVCIRASTDSNLSNLARNLADSYGAAPQGVQENFRVSKIIAGCPREYQGVQENFRVSKRISDCPRE